MSVAQRHGIPVNLNLTVDEVGRCIRFKGWTESIVFRADNACTVYWSQDDFAQDVNGQVFPGDEPAYELRVDATAMNAWLRGRGSDANVSITYTIRGF